MIELSDEEESDEEERRSVFTTMYKDCERVYQKKKSMGTSWLGNREYFASVFVDPGSIARTEGSIFKEPPRIRPPKKQECCFDSDFESGNLYSTYKVDKNEYDLILQNDINTKGNTQWFYFRITNIPSKTKIKINIVNMLKSDSLFNYGMQPCVYSTEANNKNGQGWFRTGSNIKYMRNNLRVEGTKRFYHTLTFTISTPFENDILKVAQCFPYTLENLENFVSSIEKKYGKKGWVKR